MKQLIRLQFDAARMMAEAQTVISLRMMGLTGLVPVRDGENARMVAEKQKAFVQAGFAVGRAMMMGRGPLAAYGAGLRPIGRTTRANVRRLTARG
ncbi:antifreeze protein [Jannaschia sp. LMIT008]|uniref:antifreeze protein n=1 Tax=Jannaschia maritima TaxID=3032585 RepID=UPI002810CC37|nr:antifreeze protein [Jannaschia sp. LMIT008]